MKTMTRSLCLAAIAAVAVPSAVQAAETVLYSENFDSFGSSRPYADYNWTAFADGAPSAPTIRNLTGNGSTFKWNGNRQLFIQVNATASTTSWSAGMQHVYAQALPSADLSETSFTANIWSSRNGSETVSGSVLMRLESSEGNWIGWRASASQLAASPGLLLGGALSTATHSGGTFNPNASSFTLTFMFADVPTTYGLGTDYNTIWIDNVKLAHEPSSVPEPSTAAMVGGLLALGAVALARRRRG